MVAMYDVCTVAEAADIHLDEPGRLHAYNGSEDGDDKDFGGAEQTWDLQTFSDQSAGGVSALQQTNLFVGMWSLMARLLSRSSKD